MSKRDESNEAKSSDFRRQAESRPPSLLAEFVDFLRHNRKWWLIPIVLLLLLSAGLLVLASLPGASVLYTFF
jgi:Family of unknown function (DUF5989)